MLKKTQSNNIVTSSDGKAKRKRILLAEDDASVRRFLEVLLKNADFDVVSAEDGLAALRIGLSNSFDVVVTDAVMPNMSGYDLCRMLRGNENYKNVPLIFLSGFETESEENAAQIANYFLLKDSQLKDNLLKTLNEIFAKND